jgi:putative membrane protein
MRKVGLPAAPPTLFHAPRRTSSSIHARASTRIHHTAVRLLLRWVASAVAVGLAIYLLPGRIEWDGRIETLFVVALILGLVNAIVRPVIKALACGIIVLTLGLALFVINALMLYLTGFLAAHLGYHFHPRDFISALIASLVISVATWFLSLLIKDRDER